MNIIKIFTIILCISLLFSCDQISPDVNREPIHLVPLSPYQYEFSNQYGKNRIDYFFIEKAYKDDEKFRQELYIILVKMKEKINSKYDLYSIYIYKKTAKINEKFSGDHNDLRGIYDNDLISYSRWNQGNVDIFYFIENGKVVFDMIKNDRVSPSWEFD
jgi:hypothetical protein